MQKPGPIVESIEHAEAKPVMLKKVAMSVKLGLKPTALNTLYDAVQSVYEEHVRSLRANGEAVPDMVEIAYHGITVHCGLGFAGGNKSFVIAETDFEAVKEIRAMRTTRSQEEQRKMHALLTAESRESAIAHKRGL